MRIALDYLKFIPDKNLFLINYPKIPLIPQPCFVKAYANCNSIKIFSFIIFKYCFLVNIEIFSQKNWINVQNLTSKLYFIIFMRISGNFQKFLDRIKIFGNFPYLFADHTKNCNIHSNLIHCRTVWVPCSMRPPGICLYLFCMLLLICVLCAIIFQRAPDMHHIEQIYYNKERYGELLSCSVPRSHSSTVIHYHSGERSSVCYAATYAFILWPLPWWKNFATLYIFAVNFKWLSFRIINERFS